MSFRIFMSMIAIVAWPVAAGADAPAPKPVTSVSLPDQIQWQGKVGGGSRSAVLLGDPEKPTAFIQLLDIPSNTISKPHFHDHDRTYLVIKGHWDIGTGSNFDIGAMKSLPVGSVVRLPAHGIIYDGCKQAPCTIEIMGTGHDPDTWVDKDGKPSPAK